MIPEQEDLITKRQIKAALKNSQVSASVVNLSYTNDTIPGITRKKKDEKFIYLYEDKPVKDTETLLRIKSLAIPPAWENVWISPLSEGHLQATGFDSAGRKQYRYHPLWNKIRSHTKYYRMLEFGLRLPMIREKIDNYLSQPGLTKEKVLAAILTILDSAYIRIGNSIYEKLNGSYGLTTLKDKHAKIEGSKIIFRFIGKKGIKNNVTIRNRRLAKIVKQCRDIPGQHLFAYTNSEAEIKKVDSGMVNEFIKHISETDFTAKDFRTWAGSISAIKAFKDLGTFSTKIEMKRKINLMYDMVASELGNTRNVCKSHYVNPLIVKLYEEKKLMRYLNSKDQNKDPLSSQLKFEERILLNILRKI
ncbi:MAG TPA: hypothetical protein VK172_06700 [Lentimicrobium sp.]|nr:hypothetical protein [Lentimicrobium sp.]